MKKVLVSVIALAALAGCAGYYDYYKGDIRYTQDGDDCIYYAGEHGRKFSSEIAGLDVDKKIIYRNTRCADLYARDNLGQGARHDRAALVPAAQPVEDAKCGCNKCGGAVLKRRYVVVSGM